MKQKVLIIIICLILPVIATYQTISSQDSRDVIVVNGNGSEELRMERLAIVIGINEYVALNELRYAVPDARLMKDTLIKRGNFTVEYYADDDNDSSAKKPNKANISQAFNDAVYAVSRGYIKTLVIYFAGHGFEINDEHYLAVLETNRDYLKKSSVKLDDVFQNLKNAIKKQEKDSKKAKVIFFLDACRNDPSPKENRGDEYDPWKADVDSHGIAMIRSTSSGQYSYEPKELGHGVYTYYLVKGLEGKADYDDNGFVSFNELDRYLYYAMKNWSNTNKDKKTQIPKTTTDEKSGEFFITKTGKSVPSIPSELRDVEYRDMLDLSGGSYTQEGRERYIEDGEWKWRNSNSFRHTISDLWLSPYEVTYELWYEVYQWAIDNGYKFANEGREGHDGKDGAKPTSSKHEPVTEVNWRDSIVWCNAYSELMGYDPVYYDDKGNLLNDSRDSNGDSCNNAEPDWSANGYRLPTEGEWQYFASEGGDLPWDYASGASDDYKNSSATGRVGWYRDNSGDRTHAVGTKEANALGLHDMSGNVYEWCWDWYDDYPTSSREDYTGPADGSYRVARGGSWSSYAKRLRVGSRFRGYPYGENSSSGFRVARRP